MKNKLLEYFLMFGNPGSEMGYSEKEIYLPKTIKKTKLEVQKF